MLHGFMDTGASFEPLCEHLEDSFFCVAPDLRGFGESSGSNNRLGYFFYEYLADLFSIIEHFGNNQPIHLLGHSMGGNIASMYAGSFPEQVSHFINIEGFGIQDMPPALGPARIKEWITEIQHEPNHISYESMDQLCNRLQKRNPTANEDDLRFYANRITSTTSEGVSIKMDPKHRWPHPHLFQLSNIREFWKNIQAKCLLIHGDQSEMLSVHFSSEPDPYEELGKRLSYFPVSSKVHVMKDCGHLIHIEQPEALAKRIFAFV